MISDLPEVMTVRAFAELTQGSEKVIRRQCQSGTIPAVKVGAKWLIPRDLVFGKLLRLEAEGCQ